MIYLSTCVESQIDKELYHEFRKHLNALPQHARLPICSRVDVMAGEDEENVIRRFLIDATLVVLLISADYLSCDSCDPERVKAIERLTSPPTGAAVLLRPCLWESQIPRANLLNTIAVTTRSNRDDAWLEVVRALIRRLRRDERVVDEGRTFLTSGYTEPSDSDALGKTTRPVVEAVVSIAAVFGLGASAFIPSDFRFIAVLAAMALFGFLTYWHAIRNR